MATNEVRWDFPVGSPELRVCEVRARQHLSAHTHSHKAALYHQARATERSELRRGLRAFFQHSNSAE
eukprot:3304093-Prymnesium_polylepis.1